MIASIPWARARLSTGSVGRFHVSYILLAVAVRLILSGRTIADAASTQTGDIEFYYHIARLSDAGLYPFLHFWVEYPPVFPFLLTGLYRLLALVGLSAHDPFSVVYALVMSAVDIINLMLLQRLVLRGYGERAARWAAVIYAGCPAVIWFSAGWFDALAVLASLMALESLLNKRAARAGGLIALGVLTKIFPAVLILAAPAALGWRRSAQLALVCVATVCVVLLPLLVVRPDLLIASLASMSTRGPWETLPAVLNGYYGWGIMAPLRDRFTIAAAFAGPTSPSGLVTLAPSAVLLLGAWAGWQALRLPRADSRDVYRVVALGVLTFALGNKGFSPQFVTWLVPVILLAWPNKVGMLYVGLLSVHSLAYHTIVFPVMLTYYQEHQGSLDQVAAFVWPSVVLRTALIAWIAGHVCWDIRARSPVSAELA